MSDDVKATIAERFADVGLETDRFVSVRDGEKACLDHDTRWNDPRDVDGDNYGIYANEDDRLVILDVDFHREGSEDVSPVTLGALGALPPSLKIRSPHVPDGDRGGHRIFKLGGDETPAELFKREFGTANPVPSWGEVVAKNKYVVAPGSQLDGCSKDWCDRCAEPNGGRYTIKKDREIATVDPDTLVDAIAADPDIQRANQQRIDGGETGNASSSPKKREFDRETVEEMLDHIPGNQHFDDWIRTGYAVYDWDSGATGKSVFRNWSRGNSKWEKPESPRQIEYIWENGETDTGGPDTASVGTLVHIAKENGWSGSLSPREVAESLDDGEKMPFWVVRELAVELDVLPRDAFITRETDDGDEYPGFPGAETYNRALDAIEAEGLEHNRDRASSGNASGGVQAATDGGTATATTAEAGAQSPDGPTWDKARGLYQSAENGDTPRNSARYEAAEVLMGEVPFANREVDDVLFAYDPDSGVYNENGESVVRQRAREGLGRMFARQEVGELCEHVRAAKTYHIDELGGPEWHINLNNGVLKLDRDGSTDLVEHDPEYMFLNSAGTEYDPDAECPQWQSYLDDVVPSETDRAKLQEYAGYSLMHWDLPFHKSLFLVGPEASGKSTFADTIRELLGGEENVASLSPQQMTERFGSAELFGKWANIRNDIPKDTIKGVGEFKEIVAGDPIKAERKGKDLFMFKPTAKHIFSGNTLPDAEVEDGAFYRRILLVSFPTTIPRADRDKQLDAKLRDELPGILNWALDGLKRLLEQQGFTGDLSPHQTAEKWDKWGSTVDRFASVCIETDNDTDAIAKKELYSIYQQFCEREEFPAEPQRKFTRRLKTDHGVQDGKVSINSKQQPAFLNVSLTSKGEFYRSDDEDESGAAGLNSF